MPAAPHRASSSPRDTRRKAILRCGGRCTAKPCLSIHRASPMPRPTSTGCSTPGTPQRCARSSRGRADSGNCRVGRLLTAAGTLAGAWILFAALRRISRQAAFAAAVATFVFFGPLVGWWAHTVRPDAWALAFEAAGAGAILIWRRGRPGLALIASLAFFYAAWSCKQTFFVCLASTVLFLAARAQWRLAAGLLAGCRRPLRHDPFSSRAGLPGRTVRHRDDERILPCLGPPHIRRGA